MNTPSRQRIGTFTGGGIAPGLNAVISGLTETLQAGGHEVIGLRDGWKGLLEKKDATDLTAFTRQQLQQLRLEGGTILGSSRTKIKKEDFSRVKEVAAQYGLTGLIAIGGDDTLGQARELFEHDVVDCNGVPKTIDNDVYGTDVTFGFETAANAAAQGVRGMRMEAQSMGRVSIVEIMGRDAGHLTLHGGTAGGADIILIPEFPIPEDQLMAVIREKFSQQGHVVIAISEAYEKAENNGKVDAFGHAKKEGAAAKLAARVQALTKLGTQEQVLGYGVRNVAPVASDALFAAQLGAYAGALSAQGAFGYIAAKRDGVITHVPLTEIRGGRMVSEELYDPDTLSMRLAPKNILIQSTSIRDRANGALVE